ncbi:NADP-dependent oxidoreductase [Rhodococcus sp. BP-149]|uniref:NADP-dependent oxidoreductase n=1 Tax=unclassified Rhodococcus (in: high G+C Gram-positive bacteria) TaxID=192944 RepID=UPI001C9AD401|nr:MULTISPECIES: NADP-dependent oxidoreductase [unclassified Rhodococcus (in: high G+C Gram-positive bacteria)]MBY6685660.1 NADP-dependent oxidoreductase [Rhodococcus sp. BP-288]MBY6694792.1 NADP-dependent oxidoreductase [Rhodococcus sp. BP-188]MBY6696638.1 NADP-dependent oxidoreductase [Rhodococcus sp. BP-285]MBY6703294.1 NADP-dependent oxidoreductase [Rhodococcus sp. BP-283]MBY6708617.1 NADP-dependent oxidoreductase [Rhodococcus sp. BP-241]
MTRLNTQCRLASRPNGLPTSDNWSIVERPVPSAGDGEFVVEVGHLSIDPGTRASMNAGDSYLPAIQIDAVMRALAVGTVIESRHEKFPVGSDVSGMFGVQDYAVSDGTDVTIIDTSIAPAPVHLGALGISGLTAYFGLLDVGRLRAGDTVVVSGAAGSVGSIVGQIARLHGCRTIGIAGGEDKCRWLVDDLGFDAAIDYKSASLRRELRTHAPDGIDVFFDNTGGPALEAALNRLARGARIVLCGAISQYNEPGSGPANYMQLLVARASMTGFVIFDYEDRYQEGADALAAWLAADELKAPMSLRRGSVSDFPDTMLELFRGGNQGKLILELEH